MSYAFWWIHVERYRFIEHGSTSILEDGAGSCNDADNDAFQSLTGRLIGFHIRTDDENDELIRSVAPIVDASNCELAVFSPLPDTDPLSDMSYQVGDPTET